MMTSKKPALQSVLLIVSILFVSSIYAQVQPVGSVVGRQTVIQIPITSYNTMAQALIYYPDDYFKPGNENKRYPFFLFLHGMGEGSGNNITEVTNTSLPQLIAQGLNPYGIDTLTGDTLKFIIVSPHCASCGGSYQYGQLRYSVPYLINNYRIDTRCMWVGGLSMGGSATFSMMMGDSTFAKQFAGFMPMANGGWDNNMNVTQYRNNLDTTVKRGAAVLMTVGTLDGGALNNARIYSDTMRKYAQPQKFFYKEIAGGGHDGSVWNPPFYLASRIWNQRYNAWTQMANTRKVATNGPVTPPPAVVFSVAAGADQSITLPISTVTLTGSAIPATGTTITGYTWSKVSGGVAIITTPNSATTTVTGLIAGTYVFRLTATSSANTTLTDDVQITVAPGASANLPPTANAGVAQTITLPTNQVTLNGSASDPENGPINHVWTKLSGGAANITAPNNYSTTVTGLVAGNYIFRLTVTDNGSATATSDVAVTVNTATPPPPPPTGGSGYSGPNYVTSVACTEYKAAWLFRDSSVRTFTFNNTSGHVELTRYNLGARKVVAVNTGFNVITMLDDQSYVWVSKSGTMVPTRVETDTTGAVFNNNIALYGYFFTYITIRSDGSIWYWGGDDYQLYAGTNPITKPIQLSPPGLRFKKVVMGNVILGLTTTGEVYQWNKYGSLTPTKRTLPVARPAIDIFASHYSYYGCLIPDAGGDQTMGYPYIWGGDFSFWGGNAAYAEPTSIKTLWNLTVPIKEIVANQNTIHYIDALGRLWGIGDNANGEIGNGEELVNHCDQYNTPYNWSWNKGEMYSGAPPVQITPGKTYKKLFTSNTFTFYNYALDTNDSLYFWGRNKSFVGGDGAVNAQESAYPNALDVLSPKMVSPMSVLPTQTISYTFTMPTITAGANQTITGTTATLSGSATAAKLSANGRPNYGYTIASYLWTKVSGPAATITTPGSATTTVTGLVAGTYVFRLKMTDNNTGTIAANVTIVVSGSAVPNNPPTSNAGADQTITLPTNTVTINGSGTAATGSIAGYLWTKISGPNTFTIASPTQAQSVFNNLVQGTYRFELRVTDSQGFSGWDTVNVTVNPAPPNATPVANAGPNQTITLPTNTVTLTGSGTDANGSITAYVWTKIAGPSNFTIVSPAQSQTVINTLVQGVYQFELRVTDNQGAYGRDTVTVTVNPGSTPPPIPPVNQPPVANAGTNQAITLPINTVTLTSTGTDADGSVTAYTWTKIAGPANFTIVSPAQSQTVINGLVQGTYQFEMRVTDNQGAYGRDTVIVTVNPAAVPPPVNQPPVANAGNNQTITLPINTVTLTGSGTDADGTVTAYAWTKIAGPANFTIVSPAQLQTVINSLVQGTYQFELRVTDNQGAYGRDTVTVTVNPGSIPPPIPPVNQPPVANAGNNQTITLPTNTVTLTGSGTDANGSITAYVWTKIAGPANFTIVSPAQSQTVINTLVQGVYQFELRVTDNQGAYGRDTVTVTVNPGSTPPPIPPVNQPPVANAGTNQTITLPINTVTLTSTGTDADGTVTAFAWTKIAGPANFTIVSPTQSQTVINGLVQGTYQFEMRVTDNQGAYGRDTVTVTVNPAAVPPPVNQPPVANAGTNQTITLPINTVTLTSTGTDADGTVTAYTWTKIAGPANFTIVSPAQSQTVINGLVQGVYRFEMRVTDNQGAYGRDTVTVTVNPAAVPPPVNQPPVANAGTNQTITLPINTVTLSGSGTDADGNVTAYAWSKIVGPTSYTIVSPAQLQTVINGLVQGTYQFELRVTDNQGAYGRDTVTVIVNSAPAQPNVLPVANAGNDIGMTLPTNTGGLNGGNSYDPDGVIVSYHWNKILGPSQYSISSPNQSATNITNLTSGSYRFELVVTDNAGGIDRDTVNVVVHAAVVVTPNNIPPVADAGNDKYIKLPTSSIQLNGYESRDPDGVIVKYRWSYIDGPAGSVITTPDQMQSVINTLLKGVYHFALTVEDNNGATSIDTIRVEVISGNTEVRVYPNPAIDYIDLYINASTDKAKMPIVIYDLKGVVVYREEFTRTQATVVHRINVASLKKGVYFVKIGVSFYDMRTVKFLKE